MRVVCYVQLINEQLLNVIFITKDEKKWFLRCDASSRSEWLVRRLFESIAHTIKKNVMSFSLWGDS